MSDRTPIRVAFVIPDALWIGGRNYFRNLLAALRQLPGAPIHPVLFAGTKTGIAAGEYGDTEIIRTPLLDRKSLQWALRKALARVIGKDILLVRLLESHGMAVLSHHVHLGGQKKVATIGWIPDFQHLHLPQLCSPEELRRRDSHFLALCQCDRVIMSSKAALTDLESFSPENVRKGALLQFVAAPITLANATNLAELQHAYGFNMPYFLLPNQFWAHKNHRVVIEALSLLKKRGQSMLVLATGATEDERNPGFFPELLESLKTFDVEDSFRILGQIPFDHLVGLMRHAIAFINPSRFEGWSTSVEEAKSMGKQIVLSDIAVHCEQAPPRAFYFSPDDPAELARSLQAAVAAFDSTQDQVAQIAARDRFKDRQREFGEAYLRIVLDAMQELASARETIA